MKFCGAEKSKSGKGYNLYFFEGIAPSSGFGMKPCLDMFFVSDRKAPVYSIDYVSVAIFDSLGLTPDHVNKTCEVSYGRNGLISSINFPQKVN